MATCCFQRDGYVFAGAVARLFSKAKGCRVWDLDDRELIDEHYGYWDKSSWVVTLKLTRLLPLRLLQAAVSTLNCPEECG